MTFKVGDRVRVLSDMWVEGFSGTVIPFPKGLLEEGDRLEDCYRVCKHADTQEEIHTYWVEFDSEQQDLDGDGPYQGGEICEDELESLT